MATDSAKIARWYDAKTEWQWAWADRNPVEFALTLRALAEYLPPPPARILDVSGRPGRYAIALAQQGHRVTLFELSAASLDLARQKAAEHGVRLEGYVHGTDEFLATGVMVLSGDPAVEGGLVDAHCEHPQAVRPFLERGGFDALDLVGTEGFYSFIQDKAGGVPPNRWKAFVDLNYRLGKEPSLLGATEHLLGIGRKHV